MIETEASESYIRDNRKWAEEPKAAQEKAID